MQNTVVGRGTKTDNPSFPHQKGPELERATDANNTMFLTREEGEDVNKVPFSPEFLNQNSLLLALKKFSCSTNDGQKYCKPDAQAK